MWGFEEMKKFEYCRLTEPNDEMLKELGELGWELVCTAPKMDVNDAEEEFHFKREKK